MRVSCCIIGKDESSNITRCISSVLNKVYEVIYVDTGSSDNTLSLIKESFPDVKTFFFKWNGDFSAARNFSLSKAKGDFILYLDCDEEFKGDIPATLAKSVYNLTILNSLDSGGYISTVASRLCYKSKNLKFIGKIHERFNTTLPIENAKWGYIIHYGYLDEVLTNKKKSERNIRMLEEELKNVPEASNYYYLGIEYYNAKDYTKARKLSQEGLAKLTDSPYDKTFSPLLYGLLLTSSIRLQDEPSVAEFELKYLQESYSPECYLNLLKWYIDKQDEYKIYYYLHNTLKWANAERLPVKIKGEHLTYKPYILVAAYYINKDPLLSLHFLELAVVEGCKELDVLKSILTLMPKSERNIAKFNYYETLLENNT